MYSVYEYRDMRFFIECMHGGQREWHNNNLKHNLKRCFVRIFEQQRKDHQEELKATSKLRKSPPPNYRGMCLSKIGLSSHMRIRKNKQTSCSFIKGLPRQKDSMQFYRKDKGGLKMALVSRRLNVYMYFTQKTYSSSASITASCSSSMV